MKLAVLAVAPLGVLATFYCPSADDLVVAYTDGRYPAPELKDQGWHITGGGGVASLAAFNLLGGYVEFDVDLANVQAGVNANVYSISPSEFKYGHFHKKSDYCDGAQTGEDFCLEVDWLEANGHCGGAMTIHAIEGEGTGCTAWGCRSSFKFGQTKYHVRVDYDESGRVTVQRNGHVVPDMYPTPGDDIWAIIKQNHEQHGSVVYSSEWVGWVPYEACGVDGDLASSSFTVSNLVVSGSVVMGPEPRQCAAPPTPRRRRRRSATRRRRASRRRRSRESCADEAHDCRAAACCQDPARTCYEKDASWASCRDTGSCAPGSINPYDPPNARTPWTCTPIDGSAPSPAPSPRRRRSRENCADNAHDCRAAACCQDPARTCYEKDASWASCRDTGSCVPGAINPYDPPNARTPWTCTPIGGLNAPRNDTDVQFV